MFNEEEFDKKISLKKELEKLASLIPEEEHGKLRLPIYLEMSASKDKKRAFHHYAIHVYHGIEHQKPIYTLLPSKTLQRWKNGENIKALRFLQA